jgi:hypothetical protein
LFPSDRLPKGNAPSIIIEDKEVTLLNPCALQNLETPINQLTTKAVPPPFRMDSQVVDVSSSSIMTGQDRPDEQALGSGEETNSGISFQIGPDIFLRVSVAQPDSFTLSP